jgi:hypothetical protein
MVKFFKQRVCGNKNLDFSKAMNGNPVVFGFLHTDDIKNAIHTVHVDTLIG